MILIVWRGIYLVINQNGGDSRITGKGMHEKTKKKLEIMTEMYGRGCSIDEIATATGYKGNTVYDMLVTHGIIVKSEEPEVLVFAKARPRKPVEVTIRGKKYLDVTAAFID